DPNVAQKNALNRPRLAQHPELSMLLMTGAARLPRQRLNASPRLRRRSKPPKQKPLNEYQFVDPRCASRKTWKRVSPFRPRHRKDRSLSSCWMRIDVSSINISRTPGARFLTRT